MSTAETLAHCLPAEVNSGPWLTSYTLPYLQALPHDTEYVLPICSMRTPLQACASLGDFVLPPLYREALNASLQERLLDRILNCFPDYGQRETNRERVRIVDVPNNPAADSQLNARPDDSPRVIAFSVDTAVEEHGPHLPLATDTIQSYGVLRQVLEGETIEGLELFRPLDYGQLTWGLPFGFSVDLSVDLLSEYVAGFAQAAIDLMQPTAIYVVDVHGSITHRQAIVAGLKQVSGARWAFRWLHEPLAEFASARGDQHAGGVETACVEHLNPKLLDPDWWPHRLEEIAEGQMSFEKAVELTPDLDQFTRFVHERALNGVIGDIRNYPLLDSTLMYERMTSLACNDIERLLGDNTITRQDPGQALW